MHPAPTTRRSRAAALAIAAAAGLLAGGGGAACGGPAVRDSELGRLRAACSIGDYWDGAACRPRGEGAALIDRGVDELAAFRADEAIALLERARSLGPHGRTRYVTLYEQLGIAYAYVDRERDARAAFDMLLQLEPGHLLSYTLSPKATFLFEQARADAAKRQPPTVDLTWPRALDVAEPTPVDVEVVTDTGGLLSRAVLYLRRAGERDYRAVDLRLPAPGEYQRVQLPRAGGAEATVLQMYLTAMDASGNEVLVWARPERPRELVLAFNPGARWYSRWWVWAIAGGVVATGTGTAVYLLGREPSPTAAGEVIWRGLH